MPQSQAVEIPKRFPLVIEPSNRDDDTGKDAKLVNCFRETHGAGQDAEYWIYKRAGVIVNASLSKSGNGLGMYTWRGSVYAIFGTALYKDGVSIGTVDGTGLYSFDETLGATPNLIMQNTHAAYSYNGSALTTLSAFPANAVPGLAYLDGTSYMMDITANIHGSGLNDPTTWNALNVIVAQIEPDAGIALAKQLVYVIAFKQWSTEVFFDAGNATGSPLGPVQGAKASYGCGAPFSIQRIDDTLLWLASNRSSANQVLMLEGLKVQIVSTKPVERLLDCVDLTTVYSWAFKDEGHNFYLLTVKAANLTLCYDLREHAWSQWTDSLGNYYPIVSSTYDAAHRKHYWQHETNGIVYEADRDYTNDAGLPITVDIYTPNFDAGVRRRKQMGMLKFIADQTPGSVLQVRSNNNDYKADKWTNFRKVELSREQPWLTNCGTFVRRAYHLRHQSNTRLRLQALEMQLDIGTL